MNRKLLGLLAIFGLVGVLPFITQEMIQEFQCDQRATLEEELKDVREASQSAIEFLSDYKKTVGNYPSQLPAAIQGTLQRCRVIFSYSTDGQHFILEFGSIATHGYQYWYGDGITPHPKNGKWSFSR